MYKSKDQTEDTRQSSSAGSTEAQAQPSEPLAKRDNTKTSTPSTKKQLQHIRIDDKVLQHAVIAKAALSYLLKSGLAKKYKVLSEDEKTVKEIQIVFDPALWTESLDLLVNEAK